MIAAPIGVGLITAGLAWLGQTEVEGQAASVTYLKSAASMAYLSTIAYAFVAALVEGSISMGLWALDERQERLERARDEGREEADKEYQQKLALAVKEHEDALAAVRERAKAEGIDLDRFLRPPGSGLFGYGRRRC